MQVNTSIGERFCALTIGIALLLLTQLMMPGRAEAGTCTYASANNVVQARAQLVGAITVGRDVPVGTEIYRATFNTSTSVLMNCQPGTYHAERRYASLPFGASGYVDPQYGVVYKTSIPGIGAVIWYSNHGLPFKEEPTTWTIGTNYNFLPGVIAMDLSLIKIGDIAPGTLTGASLPTFEYVFVGDTTVPVSTGQYVGSLNVVSSTCLTPDINIDLGDHGLSELTGTVGSATSWVDVPIKLDHCPAFFGRYKRQLTTDGSSATTATTTNDIGYQINPTTSVIDASRGVMAVRAGGATGVGIQMADANDNPIRYGTRVSSGLSLNQTDGTSYTIHLKARYYETATATGPGIANGSATVTLSYL